MSKEGAIMDMEKILIALKNKQITPELARNYLDNNREKSSNINSDNGKIAIIGMSGRYPKADNLNDYWEILYHGKNVISKMPASRWMLSQHVLEQMDKINCKYLGALDEPDCFDPLFFEISPSEAEFMDPQHRIFIEEGYKAFEDAGYSRKRLNGYNCGIYLGIVDSDYKSLKRELDGNSGTVTSGSNSIAAARLSYFYNLKGPALTIDTACSSSLVCTHLASQALRDREIDMALVAGVSIYVNPESYLLMNAAGMLSNDGKCKAFSNEANGFVPGEGCGALVLKRLEDACKDGDYIYGVIIGSGINQDGKSNSITAPNLGSQIELIHSIHSKYGIDPETISYAELHGTGTKIGDPIELEALNKAFRLNTKKKNYCGIGSVKSNMGHTSAAAGIAGIQKVLLCMKKEILVPTLYADIPNELFNFEDSPFFICNGLKKWERNNGMPLRACISSFGFSGTNAHIVIEEYDSAHKTENHVTEGIFVLSAKNRKQLNVYLELFEKFLQKNIDIDFGDLVFSSQLSRDDMRERIAILSYSTKDLVHKIAIWLEKGEPDNQNIFYGAVKNDFYDLKKNLENASHESLVEAAEAWVQGQDVEWKTLYPPNKMKKIPLPTYPFKKERFWINNLINNKEIQLLVQEYDKANNIFKSRFTGNEPFLREHRIGDKKVLPGATILVMVREAFEHYLKINVQTIIDTTWFRPIVMENAFLNIEIRIEKLQKQYVYKVYYSDEKCIEPIQCAEGRVASESIIQKKDIPETLFNEKRELIQYGKEFDLYESGEITYGPYFQVITKLLYNKDLVYACIKENEEYSESMCNTYSGLIDGILQTVKPFVIERDRNNTYLPYLVEKFSVYSDLSKCAAVYTYPDTKSEFKYNIILVDEKNTIIAEINGFTLRKISVEKKEDSLYFFSEYWQEVQNSTNAREHSSKILFLACSKDKLLKFNDSSIIPMLISEDDRENQDFIVGKIAYSVSEWNNVLDKLEEFPNRILIDCEGFDTKNEYVSKLFKMLLNLTKALISRNIERKKIKLFCVYYNDNNLEELPYGALSGFFRTINLEEAFCEFRTILLDNPSELKNVIIREFSIDDKELDIKWNDGKRYSRKLRQTNISDNILPDTSLLKDGGTYIITGGLGGVGLILAKDLGIRYHANIILVGRRELKGDVEKKLEALRNSGIEAVYFSADVTDYEQVVNLIASVKEKYGCINGIIHSAGSINDEFVRNKNVNDVDKVLLPKMLGALNLNQALANEKIDFLIFCSSTSSLLGNSGQCDYCYANRYLDLFANYREQKRIEKKCYGKTISINWPYWENGGMQIADSTKKYMKERWGIEPLSSENGLKAIETILNSAMRIVAVVQGDGKKIAEAFIGRNVTAKGMDRISIDSNSGDVEDKAIEYLTKVISEKTRISLGDMDKNEPFEKYGIDSILIMELTRELEKRFGELPKTLFFEYQNISELSNYFVQNYREELLGLDKKKSNETKRLQYSGNEPQKTHGYQSETEGDIAIIGIAGKYPMANNLDQYWKNLSEGKDCISEIPLERWNNDLYYDSKKIPGKTYGKWGGFIEGVDKFDPLFFNISPIEAEFMDPQSRLFLEIAWHTIEDAGYTKKTLEVEKVGVYVGVMYGMYQLLDGNLKGHTMPASAPYSSIANRVSYFMNFNGPSMAVDTMCSSSLTALHLACESIHRGESTVNLVGGVNLTLHPNKMLLLSQGNFLSTDGRCRSFGEGGDGYVPGEGVGAILIKSLNRAIEDKDHIYAVIKGTAINAGGKTNGYTVPNPKEQTKLIMQVLEKANINPRNISYLEAHGTGTALGDPIEVASSSNAFRKYTSDEQFCSIGSVKSNIGHLEGAAGIASITKVILQMKYKKLVPSLHSERLNPYINFSETPFYVQQKLQEWKSNVDDEGNEYPLIAAISAFGAGGSNAHTILESYPDKVRNIGLNDHKDNLFVFSAKDSGRLKQYVQSFIEYLKQNPQFKVSGLRNVAYTLQIGREEFEERIAIVATTYDELIEMLNKYLYGGEDEHIWGGNIADQKTYEADTDIYGKNLTEVAQLWVNGTRIDWNSLYDDTLYKLSLPGYSFAEESYWVSGGEKSKSMATDLEIINISSVNGFKYKVEFSMNNSFLKDHVIGGVSILPATVYIEIMLQCIKKTLANRLLDDDNINFSNMVWIMPFTVNGEKNTLFVDVSFDESLTNIEFEMNSNENEKTIMHCKGQAKIEKNQKNLARSLEKLSSTYKAMEGKEFYDKFVAMDVKYGKTHQGIKRVYVGENDIFAELDLSALKFDYDADYFVFPGLLDSAFQATAELYEEHLTETGVQIPFTMDKYRQYCKCGMHVWTHIYPVSGRKLSTFNIIICDSEGKISIEIEKLTFKNISQKKDQTALLLPEWNYKSVNTHRKIKYNKWIIVMCDFDNRMIDKLRNKLNSAEIIPLIAHKRNIEEKYTTYALQLLSILQKSLKGQYQETLIQFCYHYNEASQIYRGISALLKTAHNENPSISYQCIGIDSLNEIEAKISENYYDDANQDICYVSNQRFVSTLNLKGGFLVE